MSRTDIAHTDSIETEDVQKDQEKKQKSRRPASKQLTLCCWVPELTPRRFADTAFRQQRLKAWQYVYLGTYTGKLSIDVFETYPHAQDRPSTLLRRWHYLCADRRPIALVQCHGQCDVEFCRPSSRD